jgi:hypothetical protein
VTGRAPAGGFVYWVRVRFADPAVAEGWMGWLRGGHIADVIAAGALDAELVRVDTPAGQTLIEVRYHFAQRADFERYEREHAPRLRAEGVARFPAGPTIAYERGTGELLGAW